MLYRSLTDPSIERDFALAVVEGLAPDKGLYYPERIPQLPETFWLSDDDLQPWQLGAAMMAPLADPILTEAELTDLLKDVLNFPLDLHEIEDNVYALELFHGPTHAFKDVGARFLSRVLGRVSDKRLTILVATSGDTGSAVAQGFLNVPNIDVVILYPQGRISKIKSSSSPPQEPTSRRSRWKGRSTIAKPWSKRRFSTATSNPSVRSRRPTASTLPAGCRRAFTTRGRRTC